MIITVHSGPPGCGKTQKLISRSILNQGRYLFACPRIDLIEERERDLKRMMTVSGTSPTLVVIHGQKGRRAPVHQQIVEAVERHRDDDHVIVLITHEGMMNADLDGCAGWHILIDEVPAAVVSDKLSAEAAAVYLQQNYDLVATQNAGWSKLVVREGAPDSKSIHRDSLLGKLVVLDRRARTQHGVYVNVQDWADLRERGRTLEWWSAWTPLQLHAFESVTIAGASFHESVLAKVMEALHPGMVQVNDIPVVGRAREARRVLIHYFTRSHRGSTTFWADKGRGSLVSICRWLETLRLGYWSGNKVVTDYLFGRLTGQMVQPKTEGTNSLIHHNSCAFIYSGKALPADQPLMTLLGISREDIERAREIEDIIQFVGRGDLRNPASTEDYFIYLYDLHQAEALARYIRDVDEVEAHRARGSRSAWSPGSSHAH
jgi:hypothetical protein